MGIDQVASNRRFESDHSGVSRKPMPSDFRIALGVFRDDAFLMGEAVLKEVCVVQTVLADYRVRFHENVMQLLPGVSYRVLCGEDCFDPATRTAESGRALVVPVRNRYGWGRRFLWQQGAWGKTRRAEIVVLNFNLRILSNYPVLWWRYLRGRPTLLWGHTEGRGSASRRWRFLQTYFCDGFIAYTEEQRRRLASAHPRLRVFAAPNACLGNEDCLVTESEDGSQPGNILYVGRLVPAKKPDLLLRAFASGVENGMLAEETRLEMVGSGPMESTLRELADSLGILDRIIWHGHVGDVDRLRECYGRALVAVSPGYVGLSAMQAFGFGVPMIVAREEPHSPEVAVCETGFNTRWVASDDPRELASALQEFFRDRDHWISRRPLISAKLRDSHTFEIMAGRYVEAIRAVMD